MPARTTSGSARGVQAKRDPMPRPVRAARRLAFQRGCNADSRSKTTPTWPQSELAKRLLAESGGDNVRLDRVFGGVRRIPGDNASLVDSGCERHGKRSGSEFFRRISFQGQRLFLWMG